MNGGFINFVSWLFTGGTGGEGPPPAETSITAETSRVRIIGKPRGFLPINEAFIVELEGLKTDSLDFANSLTNLSLTIQTSFGVNLITPQAMSYISGSRGTYRVTLPSSLPLTAGAPYYMVIATTSGGVFAQVLRRIQCYAKFHGRS